MIRYVAAVLSCCVVALGSEPASAQSRALYWPEVSVVAHLDAEGRLHVRERQHIRFTGGWNGGERRFDVHFGQRFSFDSIVRIDASTGARHPMTEDRDLDDVDDYTWTGQRTLRWRSRLSDDPPFDSTLLVYELGFVYGNVLERLEDGGYRLNHDFAFADRPGDFDRFELLLTLDPAWRAPPEFTGRIVATSLEPGRGFVVTVPLVRVAGDVPSAVARGASRPMLLAMLLVLATGMLGIVARVVMHDRRMGRFAPGPSPHSITPEWLQEHVYAHRAEVIGAAWDDGVSQAEVAATLARMVQEEKLASRVETKKVLWTTQAVLHLELRVPRESLSGYELALVNALFSSGKRTTDTDAVRERYKSTGFDPASVLRHPLTVEVHALARTAPPDKASRIPTLLLLMLAVVLVVLAAGERPSDGIATLIVLGATLPWFGITWLLALDWRQRVVGLAPVATILVLLLLVPIVAFAIYAARTGGYRLGVLAVAAIGCWLLALTNSVANRARLTLTAERVALRKRLAAARDWFEAQLAMSSPSFGDAAYPYLLAFGLGGHVDRWFKSFGAAGEAMTSAYAGASRSRGGFASSADHSGGFSGFGGGGGFSGGGGGAAFGAAVGGMAASVPSPSSSGSSGGGSSSGGGGGGSSSGGGGGGGW